MLGGGGEDGGQEGSSGSTPDKHHTHEADQQQKRSDGQKSDRLDLQTLLIPFYIGELIDVVTCRFAFRAKRLRIRLDGEPAVKAAEATMGIAFLLFFFGFKKNKKPPAPPGSIRAGSRKSLTRRLLEAAVFDPYRQTGFFD
jgi:hypothetical protein